jgi:hypothetical protein
MIWRTAYIYFTMRPAIKESERLLVCTREPQTMHSKLTLSGLAILRAFNKEEDAEIELERL